MHGLRVSMGAWLPATAQNTEVVKGCGRGILHFIGDRKQSKGQEGLETRFPGSAEAFSLLQESLPHEVFSN